MSVPGVKPEGAWPEHGLRGLDGTVGAEKMVVGLLTATSQQQVLGGIQGQWELGRITLSLESWESACQEQ